MITTQTTHDAELSQLVFQFSKICSDIENLKTVRGHYWQRDVRSLSLEKARTLDQICETIKLASPECQNEIKAELREKQSLFLP